VSRCISLPCLAMPCHSMSYLALPCHALSLQAFAYLSMLCLVLPFLSMHFIALSYHAMPCIAFPCLAFPCHAMSFLAFASILRNKTCPTRGMLSTIYEKVSYDDQDDDDGPEDYVGITKGWVDGVIILFVVIFVFSCTTINNYRQSLHFKKIWVKRRKTFNLR